MSGTNDIQGLLSNYTNPVMQQGMALQNGRNSQYESAPQTVLPLTYDQVRTNGLLQQIVQSKLQQQAMQAEEERWYGKVVGTAPSGANLQQDSFGRLIDTGNGQQVAPTFLQAQNQRAGQGLNPGQSNDAQMKSDLMGKLSTAILNLPQGDQHTAYERALGVLAGQGKLDINSLPSWEQGGRDFLLKYQQMANQGLIGSEEIKGQYGLQNTALQGQGEVAKAQATALPDLINAQVTQQAFQQGNQPGGNAIANQFQMVLNNPRATPADKDSALKGLQSLGITGPAGSGLPVGDPVNARSIKTFNAANTALQNIDRMSTLLQSNPNMSILGAKLSNSAGGTGNVLLTPIQQSFNTLANHLNDSVKNIDGEPTLAKGQLDALTKNLPTVGDKPQTIAQKLNLFKEEAQNIIAGVDPSGHIARILTAQQQASPTAQPQPQPQAAPLQAPQAAPAQGMPAQTNGAATIYAATAAKYQGLTPQQINQMLANRQAMANRGAQSSVPLQPGDRMDYYQ